MKNVFKDTLFANFLYSSEIDVDINALIDECYDLKNTTEGAQKSNKNGWQSKTSKEQEIKNELLVKTSELYVDTHFPENQKLFQRLQKSIKRNIKLTDPKNFKSPAGVITYNQLISKDFVNEKKKLQEKMFIKRKNAIKRLFKKKNKKTKEQMIDERINKLNDELKKTGMN